MRSSRPLPASSTAAIVDELNVTDWSRFALMNELEVAKFERTRLRTALEHWKVVKQERDEVTAPAVHRAQFPTFIPLIEPQALLSWVGKASVRGVPVVRNAQCRMLYARRILGERTA